MKNENGQALIFVIATMTVALAVGVGVSLRNLSSISRTSRTDTYSRVQAAAEGGIENVLSRDEAKLESMVNDPDETITFDPIEGDNIASVAIVSVDHFNIPSGTNYLPLEIKRDQQTEVKLDGNPVTVCWSSNNPSASADIYYIAYNSTGQITRRGVTATSRTGFPTGYSAGGTFTSSSAGNAIFTNCHNAVLPSNAVGLRVRAINSDIKIGVYPQSGSLPNQGFIISSLGRLENSTSGEEEVESIVKVIRSYPHSPSIFDYSIYSGSNSDVL